MPYMKVDGKRLYYEVTGEGKTALLFLHCWTCNHTFWDQQVRALSDACRCITVDLPGHGQSEDGGDYTIDTFSGCVHEVLKKLGIKKAVLVGHSLGGMIALNMALTYPAIVKGLVLVDTSAKLKRYLFQNVSTILGLAVGMLSFPALKKAVIDLSALHPLTGLKTRKRIKDDVIKVPNRVAINTLRAIRSFDVLGRLRDIKVPALILVGNMDIFTDIRHALELYARIPHARLRIIKGAGHMTLLEQPDKVNSRIREFLSTLPAARCIPT